MCWMTIPRTPSKYSVKCVLSLDVQCRFRNEFTSVLLGNVIEQGNAWLLSRQRIFCLHLSNARALVTCHAATRENECSCLDTSCCSIFEPENMRMRDR